MKELAAQINMYQAKVNIILYRQTNLNMTLKKLKNKFNRLKESTINKRRDSK
jgi:prefoldin subunit 5